MEMFVYIGKYYKDAVTFRQPLTIGILSEAFEVVERSNIVVEYVIASERLVAEILNFKGADRESRNLWGADVTSCEGFSDNLVFVVGSEKELGVRNLCCLEVGELKSTLNLDHNRHRPSSMVSVCAGCVPINEKYHAIKAMGHCSKCGIEPLWVRSH